MSMHEYRARQVANEAKNQGAQSSPELARLQRSVRAIRAHVEKAIALLGEETNAEARAELQRAVKKLASIR